MESTQVLSIVLREMTSYAAGWRLDWSNFDGRDLRRQLYELRDWAHDACAGKTDEEYTQGTKFREEQRL